MNISLASWNVGLNDPRHIVAWVASTLLEDGVVVAYGSAVLTVGHFRQSSTVQIIRLDNIINCMEEQHICQQFLVSEHIVQQITQLLEGSISGGEDRPMTFAQCMDKVGLLDGRTQGGEIIQTTSNID